MFNQRPKRRLVKAIGVISGVFSSVIGLAIANTAEASAFAMRTTCASSFPIASDFRFAASSCYVHWEPSNPGEGAWYLNEARIRNESTSVRITNVGAYVWDSVAGFQKACHWDSVEPGTSVVCRLSVPTPKVIGVTSYTISAVAMNINGRNFFVTTNSNS
jgi:hypothetical protein